MECNIIILSGEQNLQRFNICPDNLNLPAEAKCHIASGFQEGIYQVMVYNYDLIIITVLQASMEFTEQVIEEIRKFRNTPILAVIPPAAEWKERYIKAGADQVLWESDSERELGLAACALVRRYRWNAKEQSKHKIVREGPLVLDYTSHCAIWNGQELKLVKREFDFLFLLAATPGRIYTYEQIYRIIICEEAVPENISNLVWCMVHRLRKKLSGTDPRLRKMVQSKKGVGYYFQRTPNI